jgi:hypothetical protein
MTFFNQTGKGLIVFWNKAELSSCIWKLLNAKVQTAEAEALQTEAQKAETQKALEALS